MAEADKQLKIAQLERVTGTHRSTIRHYHALGLLPPTDQRGPKLHLYGPEHVACLRDIRRLRAQGLSLADIKPLVRRRASRKPPARHVETGPIRKRILHAAVGRLVAVGYDGMRLEDLAKSLRIAKATLYRHFPSKQALFLEAVGSMRLALVPAAQRDRGAALEPTAQGRARARAVLAHFEAYQGLATLLHALARAPDPALAKRAKAELHDMVTNAEPFLRASIDEGRFRAFDSELLAYMLWGALMGAGARMLLDDRFSLEHVLDSYLELIQHGVNA